MRSIIQWTNSRLGLCAAIAALALSGCAHTPNPWREDGPSTQVDWRTPTEIDIIENHKPGEQRVREWQAMNVAAVDGTVTHWPLYFEDPFEDKGSGNSPFDPYRSGANEYKVGWEDFFAIPYTHARYTLNYLLLPFSAIVTPPWTVMESDGFISRQRLGYDHDATRHAKEKQPEMGTDEH